MKFKPYEKYKDSEVEWLGEVPEHWDTKRLRYIVTMKSGDAIVSEKIKNIGSYPVYGGNGLRGYAENFNHKGKYILIGRQGALCGNINYGNGNFWASEHAVVIYPSLEINHKWLGETLRSMNLNQYNVSAAQPGLAIENIICLKVPFPTYKEQLCIANFLDRETTRIDSLIKEKENFISLLKEKRQALISHAVTKGLDPTVKMKDSGVEWLGDVPESWGQSSLKYVISNIESGTSVNATNTPADNGALAVLKTSCVYSGEFDPTENKAVVIDEYDRVACPLKINTLIVSRMNTPELVGAAGLVTHVPDGIYLPDRLWQISFSRTLPSFMHYWSQTITYRMQVKIVCSGTSSSMQNISQDQFKGFIFSYPPLEEQRAITKFLDFETSKIASLTQETKNSIELLKEHRTALISAAVTGKIDVRNFEKEVA